MASIPLIVEFSLFPDDTQLGPSFTLGGYTFTDRGGNPSFVNESGSDKGLRFPDDGVDVRLPIESALVDVRAAAYAGEFVLSGKDAAGNVLYTVTVPGDNQPHDVHLTHPGIASLEFAGGGNEGLIISIGITVDRG